jgi:hypothetical protein
VNGGLARGEGRRVKPSAGASCEGLVASRAHRMTSGEDRLRAQGGARVPSSGRDIVASGAAIAGPGLSRPPDPTKGLLSTEGTLGHHGLFRSREALTGDLGSLTHPPTRVPRPKAEDTARTQLSRRRERRGMDRQGATGVSEARSHRRRGKKTPTLATKAVRQSVRGHALACRSAEAFSNVVKRSVLRSCRAEPKTPRGVPTAQAVRASREHTRCGYTQFVWVAEIGRTRRASFSPADRKV